MVRGNITKYLGCTKIKPVIFPVILLWIVIVFVTSSQAYAVSFNVSRVISAPVDAVWSIISNVDSETQYWPSFKAITNINKTNNFIEREVTISDGTQNNTSHQVVAIFPEQMKIKTNLTEGFIMGTRILELEPVYGNKSEMHVIWDFDFSSGPNASRGFDEGDIKQTTVDAVQRITGAAE